MIHDQWDDIKKIFSFILFVHYHIMLNNAIYAEISWIKFLIKIMDFPRYTHTHIQSMPNIISMIYNIEAMRQILGVIIHILNDNIRKFKHKLQCFITSPWLKIRSNYLFERGSGLRVHRLFGNIFHLVTTLMKILWAHLLSITPLHDT